MDIEFLVKYGWRSNKLFNQTIDDLVYFPFFFVKEELPALLKNDDFNEIIFVLLKKKVKKRKIEKLKLKDKMPIILWVIDQIKSINQLEEDTLSNMPDPDMIAAGIEDLNEAGVYNIIDALTGGDVLNWDKIKNKPYHEIWLKQRMMKLRQDIKKKYDEIQDEKRKTKR